MVLNQRYRPLFCLSHVLRIPEKLTSGVDLMETAAGESVRGEATGWSTISVGEGFEAMVGFFFEVRRMMGKRGALWLFD